MCHDICHHHRDHLSPSATGSEDDIQLLSLQILPLFQELPTYSLDAVIWLAIENGQQNCTDMIYYCMLSDNQN